MSFLLWRWIIPCSYPRAEPCWQAFRHRVSQLWQLNGTGCKHWCKLSMKTAAFFWCLTCMPTMTFNRIGSKPDIPLDASRYFRLSGKMVAKCAVFQAGQRKAAVITAAITCRTNPPTLRTGSSALRPWSPRARGLSAYRVLPLAGSPSSAPYEQRHDNNGRLPRTTPKRIKSRFAEGRYQVEFRSLWHWAWEARLSKLTGVGCPCFSVIGCK